MVLLAALSACRPDATGGRAPLSAVSRDGALEVGFDVVEETAVRLTLGGDGLLRLESLVGPEGVALDARDWLGDEQLTFAIFDGPDVVLNWPIRAEDRLPAGPWTATFRHVGPDLEPLSAQVVGDLAWKSDADPRRGAARAALLAPRVLPDELRRLEPAIEAWIHRMGRAGVALAVDVVDADLPGVPPDPRAGDPVFAEAAALAPDAELVVWLALDAPVRASAGAVPTSPTAPARPVLVVDLGASAGPDGALDLDDAELLGETLAHESGHALGLFHPVELDWTHTDALDDTRPCDDRPSCEAMHADLVMFPYVVCDGDRCAIGDRWTRDQRAVVHRAVAVR